MVKKIDIKVPPLGESITEATIAHWLKEPGQQVEKDEPVVELETDKVTLEVMSPCTGIMSKKRIEEGSSVTIGETLGQIEDRTAYKENNPTSAKQKKTNVPAQKEQGTLPDPLAKNTAQIKGEDTHYDIESRAKKGLFSHDVTGALHEIEHHNQTSSIATVPPSPADPQGRETRVKMSRLRQRIADRLKASQNTAAMLTTFNEIDMAAAIDMRTKYNNLFEDKYGIKLGFMSMFTKAAIQALKEIPAVNAEIDGQDIVYKHYYNIGIAVGTETGLVVPVLNNADQLSLASIESTLKSLALKARDGNLSIEDMMGGTFTISNGGIYGSLLSTPILNPPQTGILGLHKIQKRPIAIDDKVVIRPMMYVALSYDHRLIDGKDAVTFLLRVKECLENPERLFLEI